MDGTIRLGLRQVDLVESYSTRNLGIFFVSYDDSRVGWRSYVPSNGSGSFEWEMETRDGNGVGTRTGAYVEARDVRVERAAPVANVANATGEMLARYGKRSSRGLIDVTKSERGRTSMSAFGVE